MKSWFKSNKNRKRRRKKVTKKYMYNINIKFEIVINKIYNKDFIINFRS